MYAATLAYGTTQNSAHPSSALNQQQYGLTNSSSSASIMDMRRRSNGGNVSPAQFSLQSGVSFILGTQNSVDNASLVMEMDERFQQPTTINLQIFVSELQMQKCLTISLDEFVWDIKRKLLDVLPQKLQQFFNYGLFLPPCDGRAGKFLLEDRQIRDYPFHDCVPYVELKYKKRVYKTMLLDEKTIKTLHSKSNLKKFMEYVVNQNAEKVEKMCRQGFDPNYHDSHGDSPLTKAAGVSKNRDVIVQLVGGGAHLDYRNSDGQTALHKASFESLTDNVKTLLELGASPNYRDLIGLTPLYYNMLKTESDSQVAELLLSEAADIFVVDMYANDLLHQACKNGLVKHVDHLLFYGADINAQNVNGNTPLHVCAVNNRLECAQTLLFRGADFTILNKNGQTAVHVAHIVNNVAVADVIQRHNPENIVPFREMPKFNSRRRLASSQLNRRRSLSHSSMSSMHCEQLPNRRPSSTAMHQAPSCSTTSLMMNNKDYDTLKKYPPEMVQSMHGTIAETNIPRILVIPRGPKGFGFILRDKDAYELSFKPTATVPALQFFEGVETTGMAMRAGLRPGDFLLEINSVDVRQASHEQVVDLINHSVDTISLKVITIDSSSTVMMEPAKTAVSITPTMPSTTTTDNYYYGSLIGSIKKHSASQNPIIGLPPMPPQRNLVTALSLGRATFSNNSDFSTSTAQTAANTLSSTSCASTSSFQYGEVQASKTSQSSNIQSNFINANNLESRYCGFLNNHNNGGDNLNENGHKRGSLQSISSSNSVKGMYFNGSNVESNYGQSNYSGSVQQQLRCASVKCRPSPARRISAAELEHLMIRQSINNGSASTEEGRSATMSTSQFQPSSFMAYNQHLLNNSSNGEPKKFTSVAEMKRRKEQSNGNNGVGYPLQRTNSSFLNFGSAADNNNEYKNDYNKDLGDDSSFYGTPEQQQQKFLMKSCNSSPDLMQPPVNSTDMQQNNLSSYYKNGNETKENSYYSRVINRYALRPKTPPPPPPPFNNNGSGSSTPKAEFLQAVNNITSSNNYNNQAIYNLTPVVQQQQNTLVQINNNSCVEPIEKNLQFSAPTNSAPPPAPPPPPSNLLGLPSSATKTFIETVEKAPVTIKKQEKSTKTMDCRGISAEALLSVKLKKVTPPLPIFPTTVYNSKSTVGHLTASPAQISSGKKPANFDNDLRSALAKRRSKVCTIDDEQSSWSNDTENCEPAVELQPPKNGLTEKILPNILTKEITDNRQSKPCTVVRRYGGLSLRESVRENVQAPTKGSNKLHQNHHSPPNNGSLGFATKKDSGYTSSRTSLEPSECGDEPQHQQQSGVTDGFATVNRTNLATSVSNVGNGAILHPNSKNETSKAFKTSRPSQEAPEQLLMMSSVSTPPTSRVTLISQQLEDTFYEDAAVRLNKKTANGKIHFNTRSLMFENPTRIPAVSFNDTQHTDLSLKGRKHLADDASDSGRGSDDTVVSTSTVDAQSLPSYSPSGESNNSMNEVNGYNSHIDPNSFQSRQLAQWNAKDVVNWLTHLQLAQYASNFAASQITGAELVRFDRAKFTQLGVTRIAHRQTMEQSLKNFKM